MNKVNDPTREYEEFLNADIKPPENLTESIFDIVHRDLNPSPKTVFAKVLLIHIVMGSLSIFGCAQFGLSLTGQLGVMGLIQRFGNTICAIGCGAFFIFGTLLALAFALRPEELKVLRRTEFVQMAILLLLSRGLFYLLAKSVPLNWTVFWLIGSLSLSIIGIEILFNLRLASA